MEKVSIKDLVLGEAYYLDGSHKSIGIFTKRWNEGIYFSCEEDVPYTRSTHEDILDLIGFPEQGNAFEPVLTLFKNS